jgi:RNA polymerase sigma factor (sigma-70 family)
MLNISLTRMLRGQRAAVNVRYLGRSAPESERSSATPGVQQSCPETELLRRIECAPELAWAELLARFAPLIFKVVCRFARTHDQRMDLFVYVAERLREDRLRRCRAYRLRLETPRSFGSYLAVVTRNLVLDSLRSTNGRFRPFTSMASLDVADRLIFEYHLRDQVPLSQVRQLLEKRHGIRMRQARLSGRAGRIERSLSSSQRWRLLSRRSAHRDPFSIDPTHETVWIDGNAIPLRSACRNPEAQAGANSARGALRQALEKIEPRKRFALVLRFKFGFKVREAAQVMGATDSQVEHWLREGTAVIREELRRRSITRTDLDVDRLEEVW